MKAVILGDVGWEHFYHLGDEAMTQVAIEQLKERGFGEITVVAAQPFVAAEFYGVHAVPRLGFARKDTDDTTSRRFQDLSCQIDASKEEKGTIFHALAEADIAIIAGGGNLNSLYPHHVRERLAFARIAHAYNVPLFVSSQTVGPTLHQAEAEMVLEIFDIATCFGVRESFSYELLKGQVTEPQKLSLSVDDAVLIKPEISTKQSSFLSPPLPEKYIVASLTTDSGHSGFSQQEYYRVFTEQLDLLASDYDIDVLLIPHVGSLLQEPKKHDHLANEQIASLSETGRLIPFPVLPVQKYISVLSGACFSVSTRYHPVVFAPLLGVPTLGITMSGYSVARMKGALRNIGLEQATIPFSGLWMLKEAVEEVTSLFHKNQSNIKHNTETVKKFATAWWDYVATSILSKESEADAPQYGAPSTIQFPGRWQSITNNLERFYAVHSDLFINNEILKNEMVCLEGSLAELKQAHINLTDQINIAEEEASNWKARALRAENRKIARLVDSTSRFLPRKKK